MSCCVKGGWRFGPRLSGADGWLPRRTEAPVLVRVRVVGYLGSSTRRVRPSRCIESATGRNCSPVYSLGLPRKVCNTLGVSVRAKSVGHKSQYSVHVCNPR